MKGIRKLCDEEGILMICDEVQCGMGRTGSMFAWQALWYQTGYYVYGKSNRKRNSGRSVCNDRRESQKYSLEPGDHGTTYGGNPLACTAVSKTIEIFEKEESCGTCAGNRRISDRKTRRTEVRM